MRCLAPLAFLVLAGCGGGRQSDGFTIVPLAAHGEVAISPENGFNGSGVTFRLTTGETRLQAGTLTLGPCFDTTPSPVDGASTPVRRVEMTLAGYTGKRGAAYALGDGANTLTLHETDLDGNDKIWVVSGGKIVDGGIDDAYRYLRMEKVTVAPVVGTGATGTATLSGGLHIEFAPGEDPTAAEPKGKRRA